MDPMKRVRLAVLFLLVAALLASTPLLAAPKPEPPPDFVLSPVGNEPNASGDAWVYYRTRASFPFPQTYLSVKCDGLTPGATYRVDFRGYWSEFGEWGEEYDTVFQTKAVGSGALKGDGRIWDIYLFTPLYVEESVFVYRLEPTGDVLVLSATRYYNHVY